MNQVQVKCKGELKMQGLSLAYGMLLLLGGATGFAKVCIFLCVNEWRMHAESPSRIAAADTLWECFGSQSGSTASLLSGAAASILIFSLEYILLSQPASSSAQGAAVGLVCASRCSVGSLLCGRALPKDKRIFFCVLLVCVCRNARLFGAARVCDDATIPR